MSHWQLTRVAMYSNKEQNRKLALAKDFASIRQII
jgi:predicted transposase YbfD/YdcC